MNEIEKYPDAKKHQIISFVKSGLRIAGLVGLSVSVIGGVAAIVAAEIIGIVEELV